MPKSTAARNDFLLLTFNGTTLSWNAIANLFVALHTADPGIGGSQTTSEATYTSYARVAVLRSVAGWNVVVNAASNAALVQLPQCTGGSNVITHVTLGTLISGTGQIIYSGSLTAPLTVSNLIQPQFAISALSASET